MVRPVFTALTAYILAVIVTAALGSTGLVLLLCAYLVIFIRLTIAPVRRLAALLLVMAAFSFGCSQMLCAQLSNEQFLSQYAEKEMTLYGKLTSDPVYRASDYSSGSYSMEFQTAQMLFEGKTYRFKHSFSLSITDTSSFPANTGDWFIITGTVRAPRSATGAGLFDYRQYLLSQGVQARFSAPITGVYPAQGKASILDRMSTLRREMLSRISTYVPGEEGAFLKGILLGDTGDFTPEMTDHFRKTGLSHIVAVSGMHLSILMLFVLWLCTLFRLGRKSRAAMGAAVIFLFVCVAGGSPSLLRSAIMHLIALLATVLSRKTDLRTSIPIAAGIILLWNPFSIFDAGFLLSFSSVMGVVLFGPPLSSRLFFLPRFLAELMGMSVGAQLCSAPIVLLLFHGISVYSIISNVLVVPYVEILFLGTALLVAFGGFSPLGIALGYGLRYTTRFLLTVVDAIASLPGAYQILGAPSLLGLLAFACFLCCLYRILQGRYKNTVFYSLLALFMVAGIGQSLWNQNAFRLTFLNVGQGDSILIQLPFGPTFLVDTGRLDSEETNAACSYLEYLGIRRIDKLFLTHGDSDHSGGLDLVLGHFQVESLYYPTQDASLSPLLSDLASAVPISRGYTYEDGDFSLAVISPLPQTQKLTTRFDNNNSLVIKLSYKEHTFLLTGDLELEGEALLPKDELACEILKVAHHGAPHSTGNAFLDAASPEYAVISVGENTYGHPSEETLLRLLQHGCTILRTDLNGHIVCRVSPRGELKIYET